LVFLRQSSQKLLLCPPLAKKTPCFGREGLGCRYLRQNRSSLLNHSRGDVWVAAGDRTNSSVKKLAPSDLPPPFQLLGLAAGQGTVS
jgi:hypothetical protein